MSCLLAEQEEVINAGRINKLLEVCKQNRMLIHQNKQAGIEGLGDILMRTAFKKKRI